MDQVVFTKENTEELLADRQYLNLDDGFLPRHMCSEYISVNDLRTKLIKLVAKIKTGVVNRRVKVANEILGRKINKTRGKIVARVVDGRLSDEFLLAWGLLAPADKKKVRYTVNRARLHTFTDEELTELFGDKVFETVIDHKLVVEEAGGKIYSNYVIENGSDRYIMHSLVKWGDSTIKYVGDIEHCPIVVYDKLMENLYRK